ncbi:MAG: penicillin-binding protein 1A [Halieaceae bacterium]|jgi:penicillin-binding protein 1A|nr:penicillin-binding protein 1A [Halieaceae bacterium]
MKLLKYLFFLVPLGACAAVMVGAGVYLHLSPSLPSVDVLKDVRLQTPMRVYTREGDLIGQFGEKKRNPLPYDRIPPRFIESLLAAEDDGFFNHVGIDFMGLARAVSELVLTGEKGSGGSTLTMQVARNYFLTLDRTFIRKFKEILLSLEIERVLSKEEIFELYFNQMFLGHRAYGFEAAAQVYYGKHIGELDLAQLAMLAGLPKAPSRYNPISNPERSRIRRDWILGRMQSLDYITDAEYEAAVAQPVTATHHGAKLALNAPYAAEMARAEMIERYGLAAYSDGYHVFTTISSPLQLAANRAVETGLSTYDARHGYRGPERSLPPPDDADPRPLWLAQLEQTRDIGGREPAVVMAVNEDNSTRLLLADGSEALLPWENGPASARPYLSENARGPAPERAADLFTPGDLIRIVRKEEGLFLSQVPQAQAALVGLAPDDGALLSIVGGLGFDISKFNRATQAVRQPGSSFKPFIYAAALEQGWTAASIINDAPVVFEDAALEDTWRPENDGGKFYGPTRLRWALTKSRNLVSIRLLEQIGIDTAIEYAGRFGFDTDAMARDLSLALGTHAVTPLDLATAYASLANGGFRVYPYLVARVENFEREVVWEANPATVCRDCDLADTSALSEELSMEEILRQAEAAQRPRAERVMDACVNFVVDSMMQDVIARGTGRRARALERNDIAGKTGTTNGPTDAWFSGYNRDVVATAWLGFDQNLELGKNEFGGKASLPMWVDYMRVALAQSPDLPREVPSSVVNARIDAQTGLLARPGQDDAIFEYFCEGTVPTETSSELQAAVNR